MKGPGWTLGGLSAAGLAVLFWLYGGDIADYSRATEAPVSALSELPRLWFAVVALAAGSVAAGAFAFGLARRRGPEYRGYRLAPIAVVVALFVDLLVPASVSVPGGSAERLALALQLFRARAEDLATPRGVPDRPEALEPLLAELGPPPYLVAGRRAPGFSLQVRTGCSGPVAEAPGAAVGTLVYCVASDRSRAWVSAVALPAETRFGAPAVFSRRGVAQAVVVMAPTSDDGAESEPGSAAEDSGPTEPARP